MGHSRPTASTRDPCDGKDPSDGSPDVGFLAAVGVYSAIVLTAGAIATTIAMDAGAATIVGSVTTTATAGVVLGALLARRVDRPAVRLGRGGRATVLPFVAPAGFAIATVVIALVDDVPGAAAFGTALGAIITAAVGFRLLSMARTRYARVAVTGRPIASAQWVRPNGAAYWFAFGLGCLGLAAVQLSVWDGWRGRPGVVFVLIGAFSLLMGIQRRAWFEDRRSKGLVGRLVPDRARRSIMGWEWVQPDPADAAAFPTIDVHEEGLVVVREMSRRYFPWSTVDGVDRLDGEVRIRRLSGFDIRCDLRAIDDPEEFVSAIESASTDGDSTGRDSTAS